MFETLTPNGAALAAGIIVVAAYMVWGIFASEMEANARARQTARGFERMARSVEGWRK